ncbi:MAG: hypothetical protein JWO81_874 [Alphaproteobacteria bacterium]|nr:hypothetical protein [Alphaproteobacteria bacterium]
MFDLYKPFRNRLRHFSIVESLFSVFRFIQFLDFEVPLPPTLGPPAGLSQRNRMRWGIVQWEFEILAREIILNGDPHGKNGLSTWAEIARAINTIKGLENDTWARHPKQEDDILYELVRIAHRQFPWQHGFSHPQILRYSRLFELCGVDALIRDEYDMESSELLQLGLSLAGHFLKNFRIKLPLSNQINGASQRACDEFIKRFSLTLEGARDQYRRTQSYDINWAYTFNPLRLKPLILLPDGTAICPIPMFLLQRVTSGVYFDLVAKKGFSDSFGPAVQALIGEAAYKSNASKVFTICGEASYGSAKQRKDTVDWIISDSTASLFVECKAARTRFKGTSDLSEQVYINREFDRIRLFATQIYKSLSDALDGRYPNWVPEDKPIYCLITTLENWHTFGIHVDRLVIQPLKKDLYSLGIDPMLVDKHPLSFCSADTFEMAMVVCGQVGIDAVFSKKTEGEYPQWALETFLTNNFSHELQAHPTSVFEDQWARLRPSGSGAFRPVGRHRHERL